MGCFRNPIVVFGYVFYNIFYCIVKHSFTSVDIGMVGRTTLKSRVPYVRLFYLCVIELTLLASKLSLAQQ